MLGAEPLFTSCHGRFTGTVDYVWFTPDTANGAWPGASASNKGLAAGLGAPAFSLRAARVLLPPDFESLYCGLPSPEFPSDHISLLVEFDVRRADGSYVPLGGGAAAGAGLEAGLAGVEYPRPRHAPSAPPLPGAWAPAPHPAERAGNPSHSPSPSSRHCRSRERRRACGGRAEQGSAATQGAHGPPGAAGAWGADSGSGAHGSLPGAAGAWGVRNAWQDRHGPTEPVLGTPVGGHGPPFMSVAYLSQPGEPVMGVPLERQEGYSVVAAGGTAEPAQHIRFED